MNLYAADGLVGQLKSRNEALERGLEIANRTNGILQQRLSDLEVEHQQTLESMSTQLNRLHETVRKLTSHKAKGHNIKLWNVSDTDFHIENDTLYVSMVIHHR